MKPLNDIQLLEPGGEIRVGDGAPGVNFTGLRIIKKQVGYSFAHYKDDHIISFVDESGLLRSTEETTSVDAPASLSGPPTSTDNAIARFNGSRGDRIQSSSAVIDDSGRLILTGSTEQLKLKKDATHYTTFTVDGNSTLTIGGITGAISVGPVTVSRGPIDGVTLINPNASTVSVQQHSPWLTLTAHAWDTTTGGGRDTVVPWRIRNEGYASPGFGGGCLVFKVESQYIRRPFAIDEQGRMLLAYGSGPFSDQDTGPYYGFNGEDFGQWPIILAGNIAGLNKVVVGWPENGIVTDLYVTGKTYHTDTPVPLSNDGAALGTTSLQWSDLFLASGGVVNFANGNAAITHSTGLVTFSTPIAGTSATFTKTTEQLRLRYDGSNYFSITQAGTGGSATLTSTGEITLGKSITLTNGTIYGRYNATYPTTGAGYYRISTNNLDATSGGITFSVLNAGVLYPALTFNYLANVGIGIAPLAKLHVVSDTEQLRLGSIGANFLSATVASTGATEFAITSDNGTPLFSFNKKMKITSNDIGIDGLTIVNPTPATSGQQQHSPWLVLSAQAWDTYNAASGQVNWKIRNEGYASSGPPGQVAPGGCFVLKVTGAQYIRRPLAIDEQGRMVMGYGQGPKTFDSETIYGFAGEDFGAGGGAGTGNWPIILAGDIAGLNRVVVGWPTESIISDLYVTGKLAVRLVNGETLATSCTVSSGSGVPAAAEPNGSLFMRRDGATGTSVYVRTSGAWVGLGAAGGGITALNGLGGAMQTFTNDTNITIVSSGTAHVITWSGTLADSRLATISTAGKVSGGAITSGTIGGSTIFNSSGNITTTGVLTVTGASYVNSVIVKNPTASTTGSRTQHSPMLSLVCQSWDTTGNRNTEVPWYLFNESYASPGYGGGCLVFKVVSQYIRRPVAIDEQGRMILASGIGPYTINGESVYGFHGEDFGSYGNWPLILEGSIAGLNKVVVGSPPNNVTSDLYVTGVVYAMTSGARGTAHQVVGAQQAAVANATDAATVISRLNDLLARLRTHGLIAT